MIHKKMFRRYLSGQDEAGAVVVITAPTSSSQFVVGEDHTITWTVSDTVVAWRPYFSTNGSAPWTAIIAEQAEDSPDTYTWSPVAITPSSPSAISRIKIEVEDADATVTSGVSDLFEIAAADTQAPSGTVTVPG